MDAKSWFLVGCIVGAIVTLGLACLSQAFDTSFDGDEG
jgi:hypothetical protein